MRMVKLFFMATCLLFATVAVAGNAGPLKATNEYYFVGHLGEFSE